MLLYRFITSRGSLGNIVSDYGLDDRSSIPDRTEDFSSSPCVQTSSGAHPTSYPMGTGGSFPGGKARPGRHAEHSPPSSAEVKYEQELYLLSPHVPPWRVVGQLYFLQVSNIFVHTVCFKLINFDFYMVPFLSFDPKFLLASRLMLFILSPFIWLGFCNHCNLVCSLRSYNF
jgi:hypothetical protein